MHKKFEDIFPHELDNLMNSGKDYAILPVGSVEQHGPHLLLGCDGYIAGALAALTAEISGAVLFPIMHYSWVGGLRIWSGTIDIRSCNMGGYLEDVCVSIVNSGFKKLVIVNCHGGGREMVNLTAKRVGKKTGACVLSVFSGSIHRMEDIRRIWRKHNVEMRGDIVEASELLGALTGTGRPDLAEKVRSNTFSSAREFEGSQKVKRGRHLDKVFELSEAGYDFLGETQHVFPEKEINEPAGSEVRQAMAEKIAEAFKLMDILIE